MKKLSFKVWRFFRLWRFNYLLNKANRQLDAMRKFTAGNVMAYPYSLVISSINNDMTEIGVLVGLMVNSQTYAEYMQKLNEHNLEKKLAEADAFLKEAEDFMASLGDDFLEKLT